MSTSTILFADDPTVLFSNGNAFLFTFRNRYETANSVARIIIYTATTLAVLLENPHYLLYGLLAIMIVGLWAGSFFCGDLPLNESYRSGTKTKIGSVHDRSLEQSSRQQDQDLKDMLLSNIREQNYYLGEDYGTPNGVEYMLGGTRDNAPNRTEALRNNPFFHNVHNPVFYEPPRPVYEF